MNTHPLLVELLHICTANNVEPAKGYVTFDVFLELSEVKKLFDLQYFFNNELNLFYLSGKKESTEKIPDIYIPVTFDTEISPEEITSIQNKICPDQRQFYLVIKSEDSSSTCYLIKEGLVKPLSPVAFKIKKELEDKKYQNEKKIVKSKKILYSKCFESKSSSSC